MYESPNMEVPIKELIEQGVVAPQTKTLDTYEDDNQRITIRCLCTLVYIFLRLRQVWMTVFSLCFPLFLFVFLDPHDVRFRCLYIVLIMVFSWLSAAMSPVLVALYPIVLCPLLGIAGVKTLAESYFRSVSFLMVGTSLLGAAFSRTGLETRMSRFILDKCGSEPAMLCLGLMCSSFMLSMWINNASTTVILSPIAGRIISEWATRTQSKDFESNLERIDVSQYSHTLGPPISHPGFAADEWNASGPSKLFADILGEEERASALFPVNDEISLPLTLKVKKCPETRPLSGETQAAEVGSIESIDMMRRRSSKSVSTHSLSDATKKLDTDLQHIRNSVYLGLAYAATLGGMSTLNGSFVNPVLIQLLETSYKSERGPSQRATPVTFTSWLAFSFPLALSCLFLFWLALCTMWLGHKAAITAARQLPRRFMLVLLFFSKSVVRTFRCFFHSVQRLASFCATYFRGHVGANSHSVPYSPKSHSPSSRIQTEVQGNRNFAEQTSGSPHIAELEVTKHAFAQMEVLLVLIALILLWLTRAPDPSGKGGWGRWFNAKYVDDSVPVLCMALLLFFLPLHVPCSRRKNLQSVKVSNKSWRHTAREHFKANDNRTVKASSDRVTLSCNQQNRHCHSSWLHSLREEAKRVAYTTQPYQTILTYTYAFKHVEWGALLLLGGGFAMSTSIKNTGLDLWLGKALLNFGNLHPLTLVACVLTVTSCVTEVMSNTAAANVLLPILNGIASGIKYSPLLVLIPATVGAQFAFMLPLGTSPNAIVLKQGQLRPFDMFWSGLVVKLMAVCVTICGLFTWGNLLFDVKVRPPWAA